MILILRDQFLGLNRDSLEGATATVETKCFSSYVFELLADIVAPFCVVCEVFADNDGPS